MIAPAAYLVGPHIVRFLWRADAAVFLLALALLVALWFGYPAILALLAKFRETPKLADPGWLPRVSLIVAAHNEAKTIARKIQNALALDYPAELLEIIIGDDGSTDQTAQIVRSFQDPRVRLVTYKLRQGKAAALNRTVSEASGEILLFSDASNQYHSGALRALVRRFGDPGVGAVVGRKSVDARKGVGGGESVYWKYENWLIEKEALCGSAAVGTGEILAVRRECFVPLPVGIMVNDDLYQVLQVLAQRRRVLFAGDARSEELPAATLIDEWERRNRITVGKWQACKLVSSALRKAPWHSRAKVHLHNALRPISALWMSAALVTGIPLLTPAGARFGLLHQLAWAQAAFYLLAAAAWLARGLGGRLGALEAPYFFCAAQAASLSGWWRYLRGEQSPLWRAAARVRPDELEPEAESRAESEPIDVTPVAVVGGIAWSYGSFLAAKILTFGSILILARLLAPDDFGVVAIVLTALTALEVLSKVGMWEALVYEERDVDEAANVSFWTTLAATVVLVTATCICAPLLGRFFHDARIVPMLRIVALALVIRSLGSTHDTMLRRGLAFRKKFIPDFGMALVKAVACVIFALLHFKAWALIWGQLAGETANLLLLWRFTPWMPRWTFNRALLSRMFAYAKHIYLLDVSSTALLNLHYVIIGRVLGEYVVGFYNLAFRIPDVLLISTLNVVTRVVFPAFSRLQSDLEALRDAMLYAMRYTSLVALPLSAGMMLLARDLVVGFYGYKWLPAVPILQVLALYSAIRSLSHHFGDYYKACGRPDILSKTTMLWWLVLPPCLFFGAHWGGVVGVAWGQVVSRVLLTLLHVYLVVRILHLRVRSLWQAVAPSIESTVGMSLVVLVARQVWPSISPRIDVLAMSLIGVAAFFAILWMRHRPVVDNAVVTIQALIQRRSGVPPAEPQPAIAGVTPKA